MSFKKTVLFSKLLLGLLFVVSITLRHQLTNSPLTIVWLSLGVGLGLLTTLADKKFFSQWYSGAEWTGGYITQSLLFILMLVPLSIYIISSTGSPIGLGLVMGLAISLVLDMWSLKGDAEIFDQTFLSQLNRQFNVQEINIFVLSVTGFSILIWLLALS